MEEVKGIATDITVEEVNLCTSPQYKNDQSHSILEDLDSFNLIEPPPLDWKSDSSSEACSLGGIDEPGSFQNDSMEAPLEGLSYYGANNTSCTPTDVEELLSTESGNKGLDETRKEKPQNENQPDDMDHSHIQTMLAQLQLFHPTLSAKNSNQVPEPEKSNHNLETNSHWPPSALVEVSAYQTCPEVNIDSGLLFTESHQKDLLELLESPEQDVPQNVYTSQPSGGHTNHMPMLTELQEVPEHEELKTVCTPQSTEVNFEQLSRVNDPQNQYNYVHQSCEADEMVTVSYSQDSWHRHLEDEFVVSGYSEDQTLERWQEFRGPSTDDLVSCHSEMDPDAEPQMSYKDVPGPCDPEDLLDGVIFGAKYLGSTQLQSERNPSTNSRMAQAQEAVDRIKEPEGESQPMTEVDLFISTQRIKVLSADTQEAMMDHPLQMISYIADIGSVVVLMVRRKSPGHKPTDGAASHSSPPKKYWMICHVFTSDDAQIIAQAIGQAFGVAYQQFLQTNGIKASDLRPGEYSDYLGTQELYNGDLVHFSRSENIREVCISKTAGEILGLAVVESGWGSILPTVVVANLLHGGPAERSGELSIGDRIMSVNGTSLVGLPITTCHNIIRDLKNQSQVKLSIVHCPPVTMAIIKRPDPKYQLGFSVEDGIICSLMRGGIAERGGIRVGHRIIEINGQSVVATPHEKIIQILTNAVGEIHLKTMPTSTYRLLTGQDQPVFL